MKDNTEKGQKKFIAFFLGIIISFIPKTEKYCLTDPPDCKFHRNLCRVGPELAVLTTPCSNFVSI